MALKRKQTQNSNYEKTTNIIAFRAGSEIYNLLETVSNKSEFIKEAVLEAFAKKRLVTCPQCEGQGMIFKPQGR